jgi:hypothetical protein
MSVVVEVVGVDETMVEAAVEVAETLVGGLLMKL